MRIGAVQRGHRQRRRRLRLAHVLQLDLRQVEGHVDRVHLGDGDDGAAGADDVAHVHAADAGDAVAGGEDAGVLQLHLRRTHLRVVGGDRRFVLRHLVALGVQVGLGHVLAVGRRVGALEGGTRGGQQRLVLALARRGLVVAGLQRARVDLRQQLALLHFLAFAEIQAHQLAADLRADRDGAQRGHRAGGGGVDRHRLVGGGDDRHRDRRVVAVVAHAVTGAAALVMSAAHDAHAHHHHGHRCEDQQRNLPETRHPGKLLWRGGVEGPPAVAGDERESISPARCDWTMTEGTDPAGGQGRSSALATRRRRIG
ncbi:hypothetical protein NB713_002174 [Xanthomonas sacchari]|nr:hypothetical protein [Xanthomonas sacchari]